MVVGGTQNTSAQCSGEHKTRGNTNPCDSGTDDPREFRCGGWVGRSNVRCSAGTEQELSDSFGFGIL